MKHSYLLCEHSCSEVWLDSKHQQKTLLVMLNNPQKCFKSVPFEFEPSKTWQFIH